MPASPPISSAKPELLAPAGDWEAMRAAVANGADSVYFGLENFNARYRANNFKLDELPEVMDFLHRANVKGFVTFNTLIFSDELPAAEQFIRAMAAAGVDAVIVQDLGIAKLVHELAPTLPVHGSTQMTLTEARGIEFVRRLGVSRVVLARELSVDDIRRILGETDMPVEVFVHGALCVAYSGQCLTSESLGGRSANRGHCAQACRLPYELIVDGQRRDMGDVNYLVSPQDLAAYDLVGEMIELGVTSFKIEGRLKAGPYVAATAQTYRAAIDAAIGGESFRISPQQLGDLEQVFSRGLGHGFLDGVNHQILVPGRFPKSRGRRVGTVVQTTNRGFVVQVETDADLKPGDGIVFDEGHPDQEEAGGRIYGVRPGGRVGGRNRILVELGRNDVNPNDVAVHAIVWKTDDPVVIKRLEQSYAKHRIVHRAPIDMTITAKQGETLKLTIADGQHNASAESPEPLKEADQYPATDTYLRSQGDMLLMTPFSLRTFTCDIAGRPVAPKPLIADVRKRAVEQLIERRRRSHAVKFFAGATSMSPVERQQSSAGDINIAPAKTSLHVMARTLEQVQALIDLPQRPASIICDFEDVRRYKAAVALANQAGVPIAVATIRVIKPGEEGWLRQVIDSGPDQILVRNLAAIEFYRQTAPHIPLIGDYSLNVANELTVSILKDAGLVRVVPSHDLNWRQMSAMLRKCDSSFFECVVHQHMPMFHMEHCVFAHALSNGKDFRDCGRPCEKHQVDLKDRVGQPHPLIPDAGCRNTLYNAAAQSAAEFVPQMRDLGISHYRVELLRQGASEAAGLVRQYQDIFAGRAEVTGVVRSLRVLNQLGVTRGTLDRE